MIECSCNRITTDAFKAAVQANIAEIREADTLLDAVGVVYRYARDNSPGIAARIPSCTSCFTNASHSGVAYHIQQAGFFEGETIPHRTRQTCCPRIAQCYPPLSVAACAALPAPRLAAAE